MKHQACLWGSWRRGGNAEYIWRCCVVGGGGVGLWSAMVVLVQVVMVVMVELVSLLLLLFVDSPCCPDDCSLVVVDAGTRYGIFNVYEREGRRGGRGESGDK